jgi:malate synthase
MFSAYINANVEQHLKKGAAVVEGVPGLRRSPCSLKEDPRALELARDLYDKVKSDLAMILKRRGKDRTFVDERTRALIPFNQEFRQYTDADYMTVLGLQDGDGRVPFGPKEKDVATYTTAKGKPVAPLPAHLQGKHLTLFGTPDTPEMCLDALNCYHERLPEEPAIVTKLVAASKISPFWGADTEDSKTPLHEGLISAAQNIKASFDGSLRVGAKGIAADHVAQPIRRLPGIALPCMFLFVDRTGGTSFTDSPLEPIPLHIYDLALHLAANSSNPKALTFYIPKLETEEEARYWRLLLEAAENLMAANESTFHYSKGSIRVIVVLENARAIFRANEIMDELYPYFAGASLGWHDFLASAARWFKEDPQYQLPVKADPEIVVKAIKASHELLVNVVGPRGGLKIGGMYGVLPVTEGFTSPSFQVTLRGFFRDLILQLRRGLDGVWVAHPNFVRIGLALFHAWEVYAQGQKSSMHELIRGCLLSADDQRFVETILEGPDVPSVPFDSPLYSRFLIAADKPTSSYIRNNDPEEVRYNVFQTLQYLADWLRGNGCVSLPAIINNVPVRVLDDLATTERSRWEVWIEIRHGRFQAEALVQILFEEMLFIRKDFSNEKKIVQVKYNAETSKWYAVAMQLLLRFMTDDVPVEFVTESLLLFTLPEVRASDDPWTAAANIDPSLNRIVGRV